MAGAESSRLHLLAIFLIALSTLAVINQKNPQDISRVALSLSLVERGAVDIDRYHTHTSDRAYRDGHWYTDKAPGMSLLAIPTVEALRAYDALAGNPHRLSIWTRVGHVWFLRALTGGVGLLAAAWLVGLTAERVRPGYGAPVAITYALGTIAGPLGPTMFEHDTAAALAFGAFVVATGGRRLPLAGALAGAAVLFEYQTALIALVVSVYVALRWGLRRLRGYCLGVVPAALALGAYDWAAFGSPFNLSYKFVKNEFTERQHGGFFGIGTPTAHGAWSVFLDGKGLLVVSPVLVAAAAGLVLVWRRGLRAEAGVCLAVTVIFLFADMGYFLPYGGISPGPRFFAPALPFLALGLAEAFRSRPVVTGVLALWSITVTTMDGLSWGNLDKIGWGSAAYQPWTPNTVWARLPVIRLYTGIYFVYAAAAVTVAYGALELSRARRNPGCRARAN